MRVLRFTQRLVENGVKKDKFHSSNLGNHPHAAFRGFWTRHAPFSTSATTSSNDDLVFTEVNEDIGVATITMNKPPVNSLSLEMFRALSASIRSVEANHKMQGLVLTSALPTIFSAGLDITEMYNADSTRLEQFWTAFQQLYLDLYGSRLACVAAMNGHAPAAGTMLCLACDYRIMTSTQSTVGLNESKLGIVAPPWLGQLLVSTIGQREAEKALQLGTLYTQHEALEVGLVDELALHSRVVKRALEVALEWTKIPAEARDKSKRLLRRPYVDQLLATRQEDLEQFCRFVQQDSVQHNLGMYLESLKKNKSK